MQYPLPSLPGVFSHKAANDRVALDADAARSAPHLTGFLRGCDVLGLPPGLVRERVKAAAALCPPLAAEVAGLEKSAHSAAGAVVWTLAGGADDAARAGAAGAAEGTAGTAARAAPAPPGRLVTIRAGPTVAAPPELGRRTSTASTRRPPTRAAPRGALGVNPKPRPAHLPTDPSGPLPNMRPLGGRYGGPPPPPPLNEDALRRFVADNARGPALPGARLRHRAAGVHPAGLADEVAAAET
ncbi:MAG TPA: hypothetical protein VD866_21695 [Urbifossiella sp.]|nr:hypothetical protein [Urbifossiella sp.]